jgi:structural maintenance of chromosome 2
LERLEKERDSNTNNVEEKKTEIENLGNLVENLKKQLRSVQAGIASGDTGKTLTEQLMGKLKFNTLEYKETQTNCSTIAKQSELKITHLKKELNEKKNIIKDFDDDSEKYEKTFKKLKQEIESLKDEIKKLNFDENVYKELFQKKSENENAYNEIKREITKLSSNMTNFDFKYSEIKDSNFDKNKVYGRLSSLFTLSNNKYCTALEVTAGGKLYNVVVEDEKIGKQILKEGDLTQRVTFIPLNQIKSTTISKELVQNSKNISKESDLALNLINYDEKFENAMKYVFGKVIVCTTIDTAEKISFNKNIKQKTVTLDGDSFDPSGSLTGGAKSKLENNKLLKLINLNNKKKELDVINKDFDKLNKEIKEMEDQRLKFKKLSSELDIKNREFENISNKLKNSKKNEYLNEINTISEEIESLKVLIEKNLTEEKDLKKKCDQIESDMKNFTNHKDVQIKKIERDIKETNTKYSNGKEELKKKEFKFEKLLIEIENSKNNIINMKKEIEKSKEEIQEKSKEYETYEKDIKKKKKEFDDLQDLLKEKEDKLVSTDREISAFNDDLEKLRNIESELKIKLKKVDHKLEKIKKEQKESGEIIKTLLANNSWIKKEIPYFGKEGSDFDFENKNPKNAKKELEDIQKEQKTLNNSVNKKVLSMWDNAQKEYDELIERKKIVEKDKKKIQDVIDEVVEKKNDAIKKTFTSVSENFTSIFSTLLPGATAKLEPYEGNVLDGIEVKVAFGDVWKESLTELSGGQRSLLALSLILSLLLFKPAPMYILDEIDAALDPSHTQNIGRMLKTHFKNSQFIIVSLKEGMFNNANVLFQTKFLNGQSVVSKTVQKQIKSKDNDDDLNFKTSIKKRKREEEDDEEDKIIE